MREQERLHEVVDKNMWINWDAYQSHKQAHSILEEEIREAFGTDVVVVDKASRDTLIFEDIDTEEIFTVTLNPHRSSNVVIKFDREDVGKEEMGFNLSFGCEGSAGMKMEYSKVERWGFKLLSNYQKGKTTLELESDNSDEQEGMLTVNFSHDEFEDTLSEHKRMTNLRECMLNMDVETKDDLDLTSDKIKKIMTKIYNKEVADTVEVANTETELQDGIDL